MPFMLTEDLLTTISECYMEDGVYTCEGCNGRFFDSDDDVAELEPWGKLYEMGNPMFDDSDLGFFCHPCVDEMKEAQYG